MVITGGDGKAVGCGNIISSLDGTADSKGAATGDKSNYLIKYESEDFELPTTTVNLAIDGTAINTKGLASASLAVPPKIPKASDAADIVLTKSGEKLLAVETTFAVSGSALPTQKPIDGAASSTAKASVLVGFAVLFGTLAVLV